MTEDESDPLNPRADQDAKAVDPYSVGYAKPPLKSRYQKGESGNARGRPKGKKPKDFSAQLEKILDEQLYLANGRSMSKRDAMAQSLVTSAIKGNVKAADLLLKSTDGISIRASNSRAVKGEVDRLVKEKLALLAKEQEARDEADALIFNQKVAKLTAWTRSEGLYLARRSENGQDNPEEYKPQLPELE